MKFPLTVKKESQAMGGRKQIHRFLCALFFRKKNIPCYYRPFVDFRQKSASGRATCVYGTSLRLRIILLLSHHANPGQGTKLAATNYIPSLSERQRTRLVSGSARRVRPRCERGSTRVSGGLTERTDRATERQRKRERNVFPQRAATPSAITMP